MSSKHLLNLREEGLVTSIENGEDKCLYNITTSNGGKVSTKSTDLVETIAGKNIVLNINNDYQGDLGKKEQDTDQPYISLDKGQIVISIGESSLVLSNNKISIKANTVEVEGKEAINFKTSALSIESSSSTNIKSSGSLSVKGSSVDITSSSVASIKGSITKVG
jgi:hypothetical protein